ncbi:MAG: phosphopentomutase [Ignavibacterium sp.]|jgi:phosphopentomutase|nr:phosphopentomutase [Ignavibacterium sp.]
MNNFFVIVLDGVGVGELPDADLYGDKGSNTLGNIANSLNGLNLPNFQKLGLGNIISIKGLSENPKPSASFGKMSEQSKGKDSTTGHWELSGLYVDTDFDYFPNGFPKNILDKFLALTGCKAFLGNKAASGTEIIKELGDEHVKTGFPIIYTSADSVFQIAAHQEVIPLEKLYEICDKTRNEVLIDPLKVGRVIARPFLGKSGSYERTVYRKDYSLDPPSETILDLLRKNNINTVAIGKINDLFNYRGISVQLKSKSNEEGFDQLIKASNEYQNSLIFINLVDFDVYFGHRNDVQGFAIALKELDDRLPVFLENLHHTDRVIFTADHGNDPTTPSTDHSREYVPVLYFGKDKAASNLGIRKTFSDVGKTVSDYFDVENNLRGTSFLND